MAEIKVGEQQFNLSEKQLREVFYEITTVESKVQKGLEDISDAIAQLDNTEFMVLRRDISLMMLDLSLSGEELFNVCFDIILVSDELKKLDVATHEHLELNIDLDQIKAKAKEKKSYGKFMSYILKAEHDYHFDPEFIFFVYHWHPELSDFLHNRKDFFSFLKRKKTTKSEGFIYVLAQLGYDIDEALKIVAQESGEEFLRILKELLEEGGDASKVLEYAVSRADIEFLSEILKREVDPNVSDHTGDTLLGIAVDRGESIIVDLLLEYKADPNIKHLSTGETPLIKACKRGDLLLADILLNGGANPSLEDNEGNTAFLAATDKGDKSLVDLLLKYNADFAKFKYLLRAGMKERRIKYIKLLVELANLNEEDYMRVVEKNGGSKEMDEEYRREFKMALTNIKLEASYKGVVTPDDEIKAGNDDSLDKFEQQYKLDEQLVEAVVHGDAKLVLEALKNGANPDIKTPDGLSSTNLIHLATWHGDIEIVKYLLEYKVHVDKQDANGDTALFFSVFKENLELFKLLLSSGADAYLTNNAGVSPYDLIKEKNMAEFLPLVEQAA